MSETRIVTGRPTPDDLGFDQSLRPRNLQEYVGQKKVVDNLAVAIEAKGVGSLDPLLLTVGRDYPVLKRPGLLALEHLLDELTDVSEVLGMNELGG